tara:strand:+ start:2434 stop:2841 length:408 start_codon:yes stop_codon:yes gene_type:complete
MKTKKKTEDLKSLQREEIVSRFFDRFGYAPHTSLVKSLTWEMNKGNKYIIDKRVKQGINKDRLINIQRAKDCLNDYKLSENEDSKKFWRETSEYYMENIEPNHKEVLRKVCLHVDESIGLISGTALHLYHKESKV